jgi:hypothetical protein
MLKHVMPVGGDARTRRVPVHASGAARAVVSVSGVRRLIAAGALGAVGVARAGAQAAAARVDATPFLLSTTDAAAAAAGLPLLRTAPLARGRRELRLWVGFGITSPQYLLRLRVGGAASPAGTLVLHYPNDDSTLVAAVRGELAGRCAAVRARADTETCVARFARPVAWPAVARQLDSLGAWTLPDESALPPRGAAVFDGVSLVVEARDGAAYRAYQYGNPHGWRRPEAERAAAIIDLVDVLTARMRTCAEVPKQWCR